MKKALLITIIALLSLYAVAQTVDAQYQAADQSLMIMPTAYTMPKGSSSFTDYELFIVQYAYALTNRTHISAGMVFPVTSELFRTFTLGVKQNYYKEGMFQSAAMVSYNSYAKAGVFGNVISFGNQKFSLHAAAFWMTDMNEVNKDYVIMLGGITDFSKRVAGIAEVVTTSNSVDEELKGLLTIGVRFKGDKVSWDLGGFRPITEEESGGLFLFPMLKATILF